MHGKSDNKVKQLALIGIMSALVFALSLISIPIGDVTRIHFGNIMCLLGGLLFGPVVGGVSAGMGSMLYDFTNPLYIAESWITFINKFFMGFVAGLLAHHAFKKLPRPLANIISATAGQLVYLILYLGKSTLEQHFVKGNPWSVVWPIIGTKAFISSINGIIAVIASVILAAVLGPALKRSGLFSGQQSTQN